MTSQYYLKCGLLSIPLLFSTFTNASIGDGPRAYLPPPVDSNVFLLYGLTTSGNSVINSGIVTPNLNIEVDLAVIQYTRTMDILGNYTSFTVVQPFGELESSVNFDLASRFDTRQKSQGLGDTQLLLSFGLYNLPPLTLKTYQTYKPTFAVGGLVRLSLPTGEYSSSKQANLGGNRYSLQFGTPITFGFGDSFLDPNLTTLDFVPSVTLFDDNNEPFNADLTGQKPMYKLESHLTHNFNPGLWLSLDALYEYGGETKTDGISQNNKQKSFSAGLTAGIQFSKRLGIKATYGKVLDHNENGLDGDFVRINMTFTQF